MMQTKKFIFLLLPTVFAILATIAIPAHAQDNAMEYGYEQKEGKGKKHGIMKMLKSLDLSEEQLEKIKEIKKQKKESRADKKTKKEEIKKLKQELKEKFKSSASSAEIRTLDNKIKNLHTQVQRDRLEMMLSIREVLTPAQRAKFEFFPKHKNRKNRKNK